MTEAEYVSSCMQTWGSLLDTRIGMQGLLTSVGRLPQVPLADLLSSKDSTREIYEGISGPLSMFMSCLLSVQRQAASRVSKVKRKRKLDDLWIDELSSLNEGVWSWCVSEADKWKESTKLSKSTDLKTLEASLSEQISFAMNDPEKKLLKRSHPPSGKYAVVSSGSQVSEEEIYDDTGFYATLLKEAIASGAGKDKTSNFDVRSMNKKRDQTLADRRASKGRKIRYTPIEKLVGFLAPQPPSKTPITDEHFINVLVNSLFQ